MPAYLALDSGLCMVSGWSVDATEGGLNLSLSGFLELTSYMQVFFSQEHH